MNLLYRKIIAESWINFPNLETPTKKYITFEILRKISPPPSTELSKCLVFDKQLATL